MHVLLINTYELGHQPFGIASPAAWLANEGAVVECLDLAVEMPKDEIFRRADLIAIYVPMHTATRLAVPVAARIQRVNPRSHVCFYGLYAPMNEEFLRGLGAETILGGEFEEGLVALLRRLSAGRAADVKQSEPVVSLARQRFLVPERKGLPLLENYAHLVDVDGRPRTVGYTEASRGCKHLCRHCPIVPIYGGRFRVVQTDVVLADIERLVGQGAEHITFGDPDYFNGPRHALDVLEAMHARFPEVTCDVIIKVEHLIKHAAQLPKLAGTGCILVTCAVESFDDRVLTVLDKRHTKADVETAVAELRALGIAINPTFVAFTPWTSLDSYLDFVATIDHLGLVRNVSPIQYAIRLLIPRGSRLLELPETSQFTGEFDEQALAYRWSHPDPRMDRLQERVMSAVQEAQDRAASRVEIFIEVRKLALLAAGRRADVAPPSMDDSMPAVPQLDEPWYCCAEPTEEQLLRIGTLETGS